MPNLSLDRATLAQVLNGNQKAILTFEQMLKDVGKGLPSTIEEANAVAAQALASAAQALAALAEVTSALEQLAAAPAQELLPETDDLTPRRHLGSISEQNHDAVVITGGMIGLDAGTAAAPSLYLGGDTKTGLYRQATNGLAISINGSRLVELSSATIYLAGTVTATNLKVDGSFACNGKAPQGAVPLGAQPSTTYDAATRDLLSNIRSALINCGIGA